jgi:hypothetical protein
MPGEFPTCNAPSRSQFGYIVTMTRLKEWTVGSGDRRHYHIDRDRLSIRKHFLDGGLEELESFLLAQAKTKKQSAGR